ncbi:MAG: transketolase [Candidatus Woesearchaeota archaeon]
MKKNNKKNSNTKISEKKKQFDNSNLKEITKSIRKNIIIMLNKAKSGHTGGSLGMTDVFSVLYFKILKNIHNLKIEDRDRFILSNGHICPVWYATLAEKGFIKKEELLTLRQINSRLQGHPVNHDFEFAEVSTGSLGQGISVAVGLALSYKRDKKKSKIYVSMGDGELQEGSVWESFMFASHYKLNNLIVFIDRNFVQQSGKTEEMLSLEPLNKKFEAFGFNVIESDGHNLNEIEKAFIEASKNSEKNEKPNVIIFKTTMGKGVSFIENNYEWHGKAPNDDEMKKALEEIEKL